MSIKRLRPGSRCWDDILSLYDGVSGRHRVDMCLDMAMV